MTGSRRGLALAWAISTVGCHGSVVGDASADSGSDAVADDDEGDVPAVVDASCDADTTAPTCPTGMVGVGGGCFTSALTGEPLVVGAFCLDAYEVSRGDWNACATAGSCLAAETTVTKTDGMSDADWNLYSGECTARYPTMDDHPINCVEWKNAVVYCAAQGKRLPTDTEWQWAMRNGGAGTKYPWGDDAPLNKPCWSGSGVNQPGTCALTANPSDVTAAGAFDLGGNVGEWTSDRGPDFALGASYVVRGANWASGPTEDPAERGDVVATIRLNVLGFRCAK